jgi:5-(carboxyamino)imidazole ribonucleotide mutase
MKKNINLKVSIIMGSQSDYKTMQLSEKILRKMGIKFETRIISAHRTPKRMYDYANSVRKNNI